MAGMIRCACCAVEMDPTKETVVVILIRVYKPHVAVSMAETGGTRIDRESEKAINVCPRCYAKRRPQLWGELWDITL